MAGDFDEPNLREPLETDRMTNRIIMARKFNVVRLLCTNPLSLGCRIQIIPPAFKMLSPLPDPGRRSRSRGNEAGRSVEGT